MSNKETFDLFGVNIRNDITGLIEQTNQLKENAEWIEFGYSALIEQCAIFLSIIKSNNIIINNLLVDMSQRVDNSTFLNIIDRTNELQKGA